MENKVPRGDKTGVECKAIFVMTLHHPLMNSQCILNTAFLSHMWMFKKCLSEYTTVIARGWNGLGEGGERKVG
jgi:hypothetical protein